MPKSLQNYDFLTSGNKLRVNINSLTGLPQNEFIIVILNMVLWFFAEILQYVHFFKVKKINDAMFLIIKTWLIYGKWLDIKVAKNARR